MPPTPTQSSHFVQEVIGLGPHPSLKSLGFRKAGRHFFRTLANATCHINFQSSQWNAPDRSRFTVNLWTYLPAIALANGDIVIEDPVKRRFGHCGIRLGYLLPEASDHWWEISSSTDVPQIADEVSSAIEQYAIPYLQKAATLEGVAELSGHLPGHRDLPAHYKVTALRLLERKQEAADAELALSKPRTSQHDLT
ncbi:DUF4304 domain-containing protein [Massilia sp. PWRC2]|uniref:DUF4304 domain-containing protein n=1 Tax=Massilia sp. PWRC2 TaxID=2804626 RepID=UPI003CF27E33